MKKNRLAALAMVSAGALTLAGCTGGMEAQPETPFRGFERVGEVNELGVWYDRGVESGLSNVIIADGSKRLLSCLGEGLLICYNNDRAGGRLVIIIGTDDTATVTLDFDGEDLELEPMDEPENEDDTPPIFAVQAPPWDGEDFSWNFYGYDADGEEIWTR